MQTFSVRRVISAVDRTWENVYPTFSSSLGSTLLLIEKATHDPLYLWVITPLVNCGPQSNFLYIVTPFYFTPTVYFTCITIVQLPLDMLIPLFTANRWDWHPHRKLGAKYLFVLYAGFTLLLGEETPTHQQVV
jgi:hypothetical protein